MYVPADPPPVLAALGACRLSRDAPEYPPALATLELAPPELFVRGSIPEGPMVAVVGARRASRYGLEVAEWFARELAAAGVTVVSGFARGVDAAAHQGALAAPAGSTVAVLGCGLDIDYPRGHRALGDSIAARGALVTEFPLGRLPAGWQFPVRNRLIAALAAACVVVEAAPRSGSLVTARLALDLGREVLAVPGRVTDELALGTNALLADGARPALDPRDVLEAIGMATPEAARALDADAGRAADESALAGASTEARALWRAAREATAGAEELALRAGISAGRALAALIELELLGLLRRGADGRYEPCGAVSRAGRVDSRPGPVW